MSSLQMNTYLPFDTAPMPNVPGTGNIFTIPFDLISCGQSIQGAIACKDKQSLTDATIRTIGLPFSAANSIGQNIELGVRGGLLPNGRYDAFAKISVIFGLVLCLIEIVIEGMYIFRQKKFLRKFRAHSSLKEKMTFLSKKYLQVEEGKKAAKFIKLTRLLRPYAAEKIRKDLPTLFQRYYNSGGIWERYDGDIWARRLVDIVETQSEKRIKFHYLGVITLSLSLLGLALTLCPIASLVPTTFLVASAALAIFRYFLHKGYYDNHGWTFTWEKTVPNWILHLLQKLPKSLG